MCADDLLTILQSMIRTGQILRPAGVPAKLRSYDILLAEDDMLTGDSIKQFLEGFNLNVTHARDGDEAVWLYSKQPYDLVISDFEMPKVNGLEFLRRIKTLSPSQKVIFLTAHSQKEILGEALGSGVAAYYLKPVDLKRLAGEIAKILGLKPEEIVSRVHFPLKVSTGSVNLQHTAIEFSGCPENIRLIDLIISRLPPRSDGRTIISLRFDEKFALQRESLQMIANLVDDIISMLHIEP